MSIKAFQIEPGKCRRKLTFEEAAKFNDTRYVAEFKFDGLRYLWQLHPNGAKQNFLTSRRISKKTGEYVEKQDSVPFMRDWFPLGSGLQNTVLDGEIIGDGGISSDAVHQMHSGKVEYYCWDVLRFKGKDCTEQPWSYRRRYLLEQLRPLLPPFVKLVPYGYNIPGLLRAVKAVRGEGLVIKLREGEYGEDWIKVKDADTFDCVVTGFDYESTGAYKEKNWIRSVCIGQWCALDEVPAKATITAQRGEGGRQEALIDVGRFSGFDQAIREDISRHPARYKRRCVEVEAQIRLPSGKFRHPRFVRWREDKNEFDCRFSAAKSDD